MPASCVSSACTNATAHALFSVSLRWRCGAQAYPVRLNGVCSVPWSFLSRLMMADHQRHPRREVAALGAGVLPMDPLRAGEGAGPSRQSERHAGSERGHLLRGTVSGCVRHLHRARGYWRSADADVDLHHGVALCADAGTREGKSAREKRRQREKIVKSTHTHTYTVK